MSFIRTWPVVNCRLILAFLLFLWFCHASTSVFISFIVAICRFKHCPLSTCNSVSAMFNQIPMLQCKNKLKPISKPFGFFRNKRFIECRRIVGLEIIHNQSYLFCLWVHFISHPFHKFCPISFFLYSIVSTSLLPFNGSFAINVLTMPYRIYS